MRSILFSTFLVLAAAASANAHGYLSSPTCRGCEKASYQVDDLKAPNRGGRICRGEPEGKVIKTGHSITLGFTITAPHVGPCEVYILDRNLQNPIKIASKYDCAAPGKVAPWTVQIPSNINGRRVLRWYWEGRHVSPGEPYEQCIDLDISGGGGGDNRGEQDESGSAPSPSPSSTPPPSTPPPSTPPPSTPSPTPAPNDGSYHPPSSPQPAPSNDEDEDEGDKSPSSDTAPESDSTPPPPAPTPAPTPAPPSSSDNCGCKSGTFTCSGNRIGQCSNGKWYYVPCPPSLKCILESSINARCSWPNSKSSY